MINSFLLATGLAYLISVFLVPTSQIGIDNPDYERAYNIFLALLVLSSAFLPFNSIICSCWRFFVGAWYVYGALLSYLGRTRWKVEWISEHDFTELKKVSEPAQMFMFLWNLAIAVTVLSLVFK